MDIQYLLLLQELRNATGGIFDEFFNALSKFAVDILPFLPFVLFWCVDKKWGYRFITTISVGQVINGVIKLTVCAYRPWIRSDLIEPAGDSKVAATGYSFPSGHTMCATTMYGSTAVWQYKKRRWLSVLCVILTLLTAFSRNFLGVHTPQDVIVGLLESVLLIFVIGKAESYVGDNEKLKDGLTIAGAVLTIGVLLYVIFKPYPLDYVDGILLVDPQKMMNDIFKACGQLLGFFLASYIDRHYTHYEIPKASPTLPVLACVGLAILIAWKEWFAPATLVLAFGGHWGNLIARFLIPLFALLLWPMVIKKAE